MAARRALGAVVVGLALAMLAPSSGLGADPQGGVKPLPAVDQAEPWRSPAEPQRAAAAGRVIVRFKPGATAAAKGRARTAVVGHTRLRFGLVPGLELVDTDLPVAEAVQRLERLPGVEYAEPDQVISASLTPNDPGLPLQWGFDQPGDADIDAKAAWNTTTGDPGVVVAVIDSGMQLDHGDLAGNLWTNPGEIAGNGIDDDDDGYIDDVHGWDFVQDDNQPNDDYGHGTHVAGTLAAVGNNGIGVVGVAFSSRIMPLRILDGNGQGYLSDAVRAIDFATRHGVRISNNSWGYTGAVSQPLYDAIQAAGAAGQLVVVAAGNSSADIDAIPNYPAAYDLPNIVSVAATTEDDGLAVFSNYGAARVDVAAPGEHILSTVPGGYGYADGTSMASPHVAGVAALLLAAHPAWTVDRIRDRILDTVRPIKSLTGKVATGGMVNAAAALAPTTNLAPTVTITKPATGASVLRGVKVSFAATAVDPEQGNVASSITWISSRMGQIGTGASFSRSDLTEGTHVIVAIAKDAAHHTPLASIVLRVGPVVTTIADGPALHAPVVTVDAVGSPTVAWSEYGIGTVVARPDGGGWTRDVVSHAYQDGAPDLGVDADGTAHLAIERDWTKPSVFKDNGILVATDDGGWATARVGEGCADDGDGCGMDGSPTFGVDSAGRSHVAWVRATVAGNGGDPGVWHAIEHPNGTWTSERVLAAGSGVLGPDLAIGPSDAVHLAFVRTDPGNEGVYHATNATGSWVISRVAPLAADAGVSAARVQAAPSGDVDVAWAGADGVFVATHSGGTWGSPVEVSPDPAGSVDLVRSGADLQLVFGRLSAGQPAGVAHAASIGGGAWTVEDVDDGADATPRLAVDGDGHLHVAYLRVSPEPQVRYATDAGGSWADGVVSRSWTWVDPAFAVDAAGHHHVAVGRTGTESGLWYGTDAGGTWSMERLTTTAPDGPVGLAVAPDGTASIAYGDSDPAPLAWLATGRPGSWGFTVVAGDAATGRHAIARAANGSLHLAFGVEVAGRSRIAYATNASGGWVVAPIGASSPTTDDQNPSIALDATGHAHIAFEMLGTSPDRTSIEYATNRTGAWLISQRTTGAPHDVDPSIAVDAASHPRIAYLRAGSGVRVQSFTGKTWTSHTVSTNAHDTGPSVAIDAAGHTNVLFAGGGVHYEACGQPLCSAQPGLRWWTDAPGSGAVRRVTDFGDDVSPSLVRGLDGSLSAAFVNTQWRLAEVRLARALATVSAPVAHLAGPGTKLEKGRAALGITFTGTAAATYRLQDSVDGGGYVTVGPVNASASRVASVKPGASLTHRFRAIPYDSFGVQGVAASGPTMRVSARSEAKGSSLDYAGAWSRSTDHRFMGRHARYASASGASATWTFTGREVAWVAAKGHHYGRARIYVDGVLRGTVDLDAAKTRFRRVVFRATWGSSGAHRISIRAVGDGRVDLDGFELLR